MLKDIFETLNMDSERFRLSWISASEGPRYAKVANEFTDKIKEIGENPNKDLIFL